MNAFCKQAVYIFWSLIQQHMYETGVHDNDELQQCLLHVWHGLEQLLFDDAVDQWPTRLTDGASVISASLIIPINDSD